MTKAALTGFLAAACCGLLAACSQPAPIRVMSFNIRYAAADDGANSWDRRRGLAVETIRADDPDILGLQEPLATQVAELRALLPDYGFVGVGRTDGIAAGEFVPIFYRSSRFTLLEEGHFWLSEHPNDAGSIGWDAALPRIATWARLRIVEAPSWEVQVVNVHFDHVGQRARVESATLIHGLVERLGRRPVVVLGDFNCDTDSQPYQILTGSSAAAAVLCDAFTETTDSGGTYHGFAGRPQDGRIDWILFNRRFDCLNAKVDRRDFDGRYPSDHFPVTSTLRAKP
ncbi:MAG TPA: endonuclease/exonuclease/phosphatase family protein [Phycisphaerae bacterium]|nr:endonuclease/exonuclease/phosphatase family protein [Phycisphaerae bacterium]